MAFSLLRCPCPGLKDIESTAKAMHYIMLAHGYGMEVIRSYSFKNAGIVLNKAAVEVIQINLKILMPRTYMKKFITRGLVTPFLNLNIQRIF